VGTLSVNQHHPVICHLDNMDQPGEISIFAETNYRDSCRLFGIKRDDRRRHMYIIGKTGMGKSEMLKQMIYADIQAGHGICVVDPHGELAESILDFVPPHRINDVVYFDPADMEYPIAFNIMESVDPHVRHLVASGLIGVFKKIWADSWGPRLEYVLRNAILALLDYPGSTLLGIMRVLVDKTYRKKVIDKIKDPVVRSFWVDEYSNYPDRFQAEAIAPIQNKVGQFLSNSLIRNVVGQVKSSIDIRDVMDNQKILILNLSKGRIGEDTSALLGAMMITKIQLAAMSRIDTPEHERKDFYLYVDEFQNFATESFANILSEARKYRLNLIIAHQYIEQLDEKVQAAVFGNVGTIVCFRVGATDAEMLEKEFAPYITEEDLVNLAKWQVYLKLMIDGVASSPFSANTLPPVTLNFSNRDKLIRVTRERYAQPRSVIEDKISRWAGSLEAAAQEEHRLMSSLPPRFERRHGAAGPVVESKKSPQKRNLSKNVNTKTIVSEVKKEEEAPSNEKNHSAGPYKYSAVCSNCGADTALSFKPDITRPVYCKDCLKKVRSGQITDFKKQSAEKLENAVASLSKQVTSPESTKQTMNDTTRPMSIKPGEKVFL